MFRKENEARKPVDVNDVVRNVLLLTDREAREHGVLVQATFGGGILQTLGDRAQLEQVFVNLVMNAIEAMSLMTDGLKILQIKTDTGGGNVLITVSDTGPGVAEEQIDKIFEAFFTTKPKGMGMGLSICRSIIESHSGALQVSRRERGLVFHVSLPSLSV
jgi:signal transduction histidine kinase